jgi:hypothetical protein
MSEIKCSVVEISDAECRRACGAEPTREEREFRRVFGRLPDADDECYGVSKALEDVQWLGEMMGVANAS